MKRGTEIFSIIYLIITFIIQIIGYFMIYHIFSKRYKSLIFIIFALFSPIVGGIIWNYLCIKNNWPFHMGGEGNEPYGIYAFIWGLVTIFPIILCARLITSEYIFDSRLNILKWFISKDFILILFFSLLSGIAAILFYGLTKGSGVRSFFKLSQLAIEHKEEIIIIIWSVIITLTTTLSIVFFDLYFKTFILKKFYLYFMPLILSVIVCLIFITVYYGLFIPLKLDPSQQIRGLGAGFSIRFGMFCGIVIVLHKTYWDLFVSFIISWLKNPISS